jgi:hypothetical protein
VVIPRSSRTVYDDAIRNIGVTVITVETMEELERALSGRTATDLSDGGRGHRVRADVA